MSFYTIPATEPFAMSLAKYCDNLAQEQNIPLSSIKIFLPTRRGIRTLQDSFLQLSGGKARLLPIMQSIGDADLEEAKLHGLEGADMPPAIDPLHRQIVMARLLERAWKGEYDFNHAMLLAADLGQLIDQIHTENLSIDKLSDIMEVAELAEYWEMTTGFLQLVLGEIWPEYLAEKGFIDPGLHRTKRIQALTEYYQKRQPQTPVIVAGSTGSIPATRQFIKTIGTMPNGYVVLPALDKHMTEGDWIHVEPGHPQYLLKQLLGACHVNINDVQFISFDEDNNARAFLVSEMMRPAKNSNLWQRLADKDVLSQAIQDGLSGITLCEANNDHHEATVIALAMLEVAQDKNQEKTATLITPDRYLAMRVQAQLRQWGIDIDDSGGTSLTNTPIGQFAMAVTHCWHYGQIYPVPFLSLLKNEYMGDHDGQTRTRVRSLEVELLRGVRPQGDFDEWINLSKDNKDFISYLQERFAPLAPFQTGRHDMRTLLMAHMAVMENLADTTDLSGAERLWRGDDGEALAEFMTQMISYAESFVPMTLVDYSDLMAGLLAKQSYAAKYGKHPRLSILGQIESRMVKADRVILSGLNEGVWPPESGFDAWMSRKMRGDFGLPSLEQKTTLSAHDFACGLSAPEVFVTRSKKSDGQPTLPSRWLQRLETVSLAAGIGKADWPHIRGHVYCDWAHKIRDGIKVEDLKRPVPCPPLERRPKDFSVTEIEKWMRDPYWIYAKKVLDLHQLNDVDMDVTVADKGTLIHKAMECFTAKYPEDYLPPNAWDELISAGRMVFDSQNDNAEIQGLWWPRFTKAASWFIEHEQDWRTGTAVIHSELKATWRFAIGETQFSLTGKADRLEKRKDGTIAIIDYKTGSSPQAGEVKNGLASQLVLEGVMLIQGVFKDTISVSNDTNFAFYYWSLGGAGAGGSATIAQGKTGKQTSVLLEEAYVGVCSLLSAYNNDNTPYIGTPDSSRAVKIDYNDYAHLERISEWSVVDGGGGDE